MATELSAPLCSIKQLGRFYELTIIETRAVNALGAFGSNSYSLPASLER